MVGKLEKAYLAIRGLDRSRTGGDSYPEMLVITLIYLVAVLSVPIYAPQKLIWLAAYPILASEMTGIGYGRILLKSLWILPFLIVIGIFNPIFDTGKAFTIGGVEINRGWVSFASIILRGILSLQAVILMVERIGFLDIFNTMRRLGFPTVLCTQMLLTYRYLSVITEEALIMKRAREARGYGRRSYPFSMWGRFVGQLLIRSVRRASYIHRAMKARGFSGTLPLGGDSGWSSKSRISLICWIVVIATLRFIDFSKLLTTFIG
ncbi:MAG: cobalt ECF transporter T component CbiQ [Bacteroides sp.]|nr:cobalt ECF transporter T component CbiQ [Bacteroides sp.]